ncbi:U6 snRNA-associated Sm-like protein LSm6 [Catenaria anguillulae PL171]|uniref:U6 snRNA-associated Sm-like protein LSm6 n=1 Tax=Catenaria anguillulae PL171 TaxID=765915 RepID=A0A1Y2HB17_9FUNG|nr:U6 snRNA-associated Sm-like protein LSm6 [Catenaria anguillulae PL171]
MSSPSDFLNALVGGQVAVKLHSGVEYHGRLICLDGYMNIVLEDTQEFVAGNCTNVYGDALVRGNNVLYISKKASAA